MYLGSPDLNVASGPRLQNSPAIRVSFLYRKITLLRFAQPNDGDISVPCTALLPLVITEHCSQSVSQSVSQSIFKVNSDRLTSIHLQDGSFCFILSLKNSPSLYLADTYRALFATEHKTCENDRNCLVCRC